MKSLRLAAGRTLAWREAGEGRPLILIHGWAMSSAVFTEALGHLSGRFCVLAPDLRGHGASEAGGDYGFTDFAADLQEWIEILELSEAVLAGWSLGGQVLLELYPAICRRVRGLILVAATARFTAGDGAEGLPAGQVRAMARDLSRNYHKTMGDFFALQFAGEELDSQRYRSVIDFCLRQGVLPDQETVLAALETLRRGDHRNRLAAVNCPVLVQHGELDRIVPLAAGRALAEGLPQAEWAPYPGVGHAPFLSRPKEVFTQWLSFSA